MQKRRLKTGTRVKERPGNVPSAGSFSLDSAGEEGIARRRRVDVSPSVLANTGWAVYQNQGHSKGRGSGLRAARIRRTRRMRTRTRAGPPSLLLLTLRSCFWVTADCPAASCTTEARRG